jgi:ADP-ribose pyrophosphatase YjhB (NUDIX family)
MTTFRAALEPLITPLFRTYWRLARGMTLGVRGIVTDAEHRVLLVRHTYVEGWYLPGGGVEKGETAATALRREMAEEGGVEATGALSLIGVYSQHATFPNDHVVLYRVNDWTPCRTKSAGEIDAIGFYKLDALPSGATPATRARLEEVFGGAPQSEFW